PAEKPAPTGPDSVTITPPAAPPDPAPPAPTLQEVISGPDVPAPDPAGVVAQQTALFNAAIAKDKVLSRSSTMTAIGMGGDVLDIERPFTRKADLKKAWGRMTGSFGRLYEVERSKTARTNEWVKANRVYSLVEPDAQAVIRGDDNSPFDLDTLVALADWIDFDEKEVTWSIRDGYGSDLNAMVARVIED